MALENRNFEMWAEFAGALMGAKKSGAGTPGIENRPPTVQELSSMGIRRRRK